jgi:hypothetical protein
MLGFNSEQIPGFQEIILGDPGENLMILQRADGQRTKQPELLQRSAGLSVLMIE